MTLGMNACGRGEASEAPALQATEVLRQNMRITAEATGNVEPVLKVEVKSKASGEVLRLHADVGDKVEPGTLLVEIDPRDVNNSYEQAVADLGVAEERWNIAKAQLERSEELYEAGVITEQEYEGQRLDFANAEASLVKARTNKELRELQKEDVTIRAPMAGTILARNVEEGTVIQSASSNVSGGTTLFVMADLNEVQVRVLVDETDMGQIRPGQEAAVGVEAYPGRIFTGIVEKMEPQAVNQQNVTMFPVIVRLENRSGLLLPGMNAEVETLLVERPNALVVPNNAVVQPSEATAAASVLGMESEVEVDYSVYSQLAQEAGLGSIRGAGRGSRGQGSAGAEGASDRRARMQELRAKVESGEISRDSLQAMAAALRAQREEAGAGSPAPAMAEAAVDPAMSNPALSGLLNTTGDPRPAVAFVMHPDSTLELRPVLMGVNDWDNTEILAGLEEGEAVALIGVAQLMAEQQEMMDRMRNRGFMPGMGRGPR